MHGMCAAGQESSSTTRDRSTFRTPVPENFPAQRDRAHFATTHISFLLKAKDSSETARLEMVDRICRVYWHPVYTYIRRTGRSVHDAQDYTQEFFGQIIQRGHHYDPEKGRFRSYLLGAVKHFLLNRHKYERASKRAPAQPVLSIDEEDAERRMPPDAASQSPDQLYDRSYALALLGSVHAQLAAEYARAGKAGLFETLQPYLARNAGSESYRTLAGRLGKTEDAIKQQIKRLRLKYRVLLELEIGRNVAHPDDLEAEKRWLESVLCG
ncbi:MAG TPA: sigma-70 family RNA polymerase sigma factor [Verrucomicrobiales bacterium]|nr:sigma-70 family RNA polymerase sigma factor [Verrucomicrobiales bacterium]